MQCAPWPGSTRSSVAASARKDGGPARGAIARGSEASGLRPETRQGSSAPPWSASRPKPPPKGEALWNLLMALDEGGGRHGPFEVTVGHLPHPTPPMGSKGYRPWRVVQEGSALLVGSGATPRHFPAHERLPRLTRRKLLRCLAI